MNDLRILRVQIVEGIAQLIAPTQHLFLRKRTVAAREHFVKVFAGDVLHHQKLSVAFVEMIAYPRQRLMMHPRQQTRFAFELLAQLLIGEKRLFQGDDSIEPLVQRFIHRAHAALAKLANDSITSLQNCFWCKHEVNLPGSYADESILPRISRPTDSLCLS